MMTLDEARAIVALGPRFMAAKARLEALAFPQSDEPEREPYPEESQEYTREDERSLPE